MKTAFVARGVLAAASLVAVAFIALADAGPTGVAPVSAGSGTGGFFSQTIVGGLDQPTDLAFAPDGRAFIATQSGAVRILKEGDLLAEPFVQLPANAYVEHGLLGMALDPDFSSNGYVYLYYTHESNAGDPQGPKTNQLIRVTADGDTALPGSEVVLMGTATGTVSQPSCQDFPAGSDCLPADGCCHVGGALRFASDGTLFVSTGDAAYPATPNYQHLITRPQDLDSLAGKILRINSDGTAPADNPFFNGDATANQSKVWAYGLREPFRMGLQPRSGLPFVGDVGEGSWEEINIAYPGANLGWPCYEGTAPHPIYITLTACQKLIASGAPIEHALYAYSHIGAGAAVTGGVFYQGNTYPSELQGAYFFGDWVNAQIKTLKVGPDNQLVPNSVQTILSGSGMPVDFEIGPEGDIYYLTLDSPAYTGEVRHLRFVPGNRPPVAHASAAPRGGLAPLSVQFSSAGSFDPDADGLLFSWSFDDGQTSTEPNPMHTYTSNGTYHPTLTVSDPDLAESTAQVSVIVGNQPPQAIITAPTANFVYLADQVVTFSGTGSDPETGAIPPSSRDWTVLLHHCYVATRTCHTHPFLTTNGGSGTLIAPNQGSELMFLEVTLTVTDSVGLTGSTSIMIGPDTDGDGVRDFEELLTYRTDYLNADTDGDSCPDGKELGSNAQQGGMRDPLNPWDYFNPSHDGQNRIDDFLLVAHQYFIDSGNPAYNPDTDRTLPMRAPHLWNLGPPNGLQRLDDILIMLQQYHHDCAP